MNLIHHCSTLFSGTALGLSLISRQIMVYAYWSSLVAKLADPGTRSPNPMVLTVTKEKYAASRRLQSASHFSNTDAPIKMYT